MASYRKFKPLMDFIYPGGWARPGETIDLLPGSMRLDDLVSKKVLVEVVGDAHPSTGKRRTS